MGEYWISYLDYNLFPQFWRDSNLDFELSFHYVQISLFKRSLYCFNSVIRNAVNHEHNMFIYAHFHHFRTLLYVYVYYELYVHILYVHIICSSHLLHFRTILGIILKPYYSSEMGNMQWHVPHSAGRSFFIQLYSLNQLFKLEDIYQN